MTEWVYNRGRARTVPVLEWVTNPAYRPPFVRVTRVLDSNIGVDIDGNQTHHPRTTYKRLDFPDLWIGDKLSYRGDYAMVRTFTPDERQYLHNEVCIGPRAVEMVLAGRITPSEAFWNTASELRYWNHWAAKR